MRPLQEDGVDCQGADADGKTSRVCANLRPEQSKRSCCATERLALGACCSAQAFAALF